MFASFFSKRNPSIASKRSSRQRKLRLESLETRELLSGDGTGVGTALESTTVRAAYVEQEAATFAPYVLVTIEEDVVDHTDDFAPDGSPYRISLREAYYYVDKYWLPNGFNGDAQNAWKFWIADPRANTRPNKGTLKTIQFDSKLEHGLDASGAAVSNYDELRGVEDCLLDSQLVSRKNYSIVGINLSGEQVVVHGANYIVNRHGETIANPTANVDDPVVHSRAFYVQSGELYLNSLDIADCVSVACSDGNYSNDSAHGYSGFELKNYNSQGGAIFVDSGSYLSFKGTISHSVAIKNGGAVFVNDGGSANLTDARLIGNQAASGGAISNYGYFFADGSSVFQSNRASKLGGAYFGYGEFYVGNVAEGEFALFKDNVATGEPSLDGFDVEYGSGGAIYNTSRGNVLGYVSLNNCRFEGNDSYQYGGAVVNFAELNVCNSTFTGNSSGDGGAIMTAQSAFVSDCAFVENQARLLRDDSTNDPIWGEDVGGNGGAIFVARGNTNGAVTTTLSGLNRFERNVAENLGGAICFVPKDQTFASGSELVFIENSAAIAAGACAFWNDAIVEDDSVSFVFENNRANNAYVVESEQERTTRGNTIAVFGPVTQTKETFGLVDDEDYHLFYRQQDDALTGGGLTFDKFDAQPGDVVYVWAEKQSRWLKITEDVFFSYQTQFNFTVSGEQSFYYYIVDPNGTRELTQIVSLKLSDGVSLRVDPLAAHETFIELGVVGLEFNVESEKPVATWRVDWGDGTVDEYDALGYELDAWKRYETNDARNVAVTLLYADGSSDVFENVFLYVPQFDVDETNNFNEESK